MNKLKIGLEEVASAILPSAFLIVIISISIFVGDGFKFDRSAFHAFADFFDVFSNLIDSNIFSATFFLILSISALYMAGSFIDSSSHFLMIESINHILEGRKSGHSGVRKIIQAILFFPIFVATIFMPAHIKLFTILDFLKSDEEVSQFKNVIMEKFGIDPYSDSLVIGDLYWRVYFLLLAGNPSLFSKIEVYHSKRRLYLNSTSVFFLGYLYSATDFIVTWYQSPTNFNDEFWFTLIFTALMFFLSVISFREYLSVRYISYQYMAYSVLAFGAQEASNHNNQLYHHFP